MPRTCKLGSPLRTATTLAFISLVAPLFGQTEEMISPGFKPDRYQNVWQHNPFTLVAPVAVQAQPTLFDKLILLSWLNDGGSDVVFVQNTETNAVQKVTREPNADNLKLVEVHGNPDPRKVEVVLSHGAEKGIVKFRTESQVALSQAPGTSAPGAAQSPGAAPGAQPFPGTRGQTPGQQSSFEAFQQAARTGTVQAQQGGVPTQPENAVHPPRASDVRRKRLTAPPAREEPVNPQQPYQNPAPQPQGQ
jgi:hypothetical protein